jgi:N6-L-threonylcarbamoyladenine synthase
MILGLETSCDETAASVVCDGRQVLSNAVASQHDLHAKFGGVVPEIASRAHIERIMPIVDTALEQAGASLTDLTAIAVGNRPGLIGSLLVGVSAAKSLAWSLGLPLIGVDHVRAHLYAAGLDGEPVNYPALGLVVSGGHTSLYRVDSPLAVRLLGKTIDDAIGEAYDKVAAILEMGFPGGPAVDAAAQHGDPRAINFPRTLLDRDSLDFSFSGLKTAVLYQVRGQPRGRGNNAAFQRSAADLSEQQKADVAASFQAAAVDVVITKLDRAMTQQSDAGRTVTSIIIGGGVSANSHLRERVMEFGPSHEIAVHIPPMAYCLDNAAMVAGLAHHHLQAGQISDLSLAAIATTELR